MHPKTTIIFNINIKPFFKIVHVRIDFGGHHVKKILMSSKKRMDSECIFVIMTICFLCKVKMWTQEVCHNNVRKKKNTPSNENFKNNVH